MKKFKDEWFKWLKIGLEPKNLERKARYFTIHPV